MNTLESTLPWGEFLDPLYMKDAEAGVTLIDNVLWGQQQELDYCEPDEVQDDAITSIERHSEYDEFYDNNELLPQTIHEQESQINKILLHPQMKIYVTAYYKPERNEEYYLPRERDLQLSFVYTPQNYWNNHAVSFPTTPEESFYIKRKDPDHLGEIVFNSDMNTHAISIEKNGAEVRSDALRKRQQRNNGEEPPETQEKSAKVKRRKIKNEEDKEEGDLVISKGDKSFTVRVVVGEFKFSRTFEIRTVRDLNKYRYLRKCVEIYCE